MVAGGREGRFGRAVRRGVQRALESLELESVLGVGRGRGDAPQAGPSERQGGGRGRGPAPLVLVAV